MSEVEFQVIRGAGFVLALGLAASLQRFSPFAAMRESWRVNGLLWAVNALTIGVLCGACACTVARWAEATEFGLNLAAAPLWVAIPLSVLALDLVSYGWHRANHVIPFLWRFHQVHHSDAAFTATTALRFHPGEILLSLPLRLSAVAVLGVPVAAIVAFEVVFAFANFVEHGNIRLHLGFERNLQRLFVTPALHRRHHSRERRLLDTNFATIFSFWDRLFGSFGPNTSSTQVRIGLPGAASIQRPWAALALPARELLQGE
jgi:sterol desaturase/sphingolipid hydroxylase (fatty acid hydroxylase superfamily)